MKKSDLISAIGQVVLCAVLLIGCASDGPLAPSGNAGAPTSAQNSPAIQNAGGSTVPQVLRPPSVVSNDVYVVSNVRRILFPAPNVPATDTLSSSVLATPNGSAVVRVSWSNLDAAGKKLSTVRMQLRIPPGAVNVPTIISITVDPNSPVISAEFGPSGLVFNTPALLDVKATGLDLSGFSSSDRIDLWYVNAGGWVGTMQYNTFSLNTNVGKFNATGIQIPHFSRYCFGR